jgi:hypothetical protein
MISYTVRSLSRTGLESYRETSPESDANSDRLLPDGDLTFDASRLDVSRPQGGWLQHPRLWLGQAQWLVVDRPSGKQIRSRATWSGTQLVWAKSPRTVETVCALRRAKAAVQRPGFRGVRHSSTETARWRWVAGSRPPARLSPSSVIGSTRVAHALPPRRRRGTAELLAIIPLTAVLGNSVHV